MRNVICNQKVQMESFSPPFDSLHITFFACCLWSASTTIFLSFVPFNHKMYMYSERDRERYTYYIFLFLERGRGRYNKERERDGDSLFVWHCLCQRRAQFPSSLFHSLKFLFSLFLRLSIFAFFLVYLPPCLSVQSLSVFPLSLSLSLSPTSFSVSVCLSVSLSLSLSLSCSLPPSLYPILLLPFLLPFPSVSLSMKRILEHTSCCPILNTSCVLINMFIIEDAGSVKGIKALQRIFNQIRSKSGKC